MLRSVREREGGERVREKGERERVRAKEGGKRRGELQAEGGKLSETTILSLRVEWRQGGGRESKDLARWNVLA